MVNRNTLQEIVCTARGQVEVVTQEGSRGPRAHEIEIETRYSLVSPGTEGSIYKGTHIGYSQPSVPDWLRYPVRLGYCLVGTVTRVGRNITSFESGDLVLAYVPHANRAVVDVRLVPVYHVPADVPPRRAAAAQLASISLTAVRAARPEPGDTVVVIGLGLIGILAAQLFHIAGCRPVIGVDPVAERVQRAVDCGIQASAPSVSEARRLLAEHAGDRRADVVVDATGVVEVITESFSLAEPGSCVVLLGSPRHELKLDAYQYIHSSGIRLLGAHIDSTDHPETRRDKWTRRRNVEYAMRLLADRSLSVEPLITDVVAPHQMPAIYQSIAESPAMHLGVLIDWSEVDDE